jgi:putative NADH-flavin reductase
MKIALFGASGMVGKRIMDEAVRRGHEVTAIVRHPQAVNTDSDRVSVQQGDATDAARVAELVAGHDVVIDAIAPPRGPFATAEVLPRAVRGLIEGMSKAGVKRLLVVGGAGSLLLGDGTPLFSTPTFPEAYRAEAIGQRQALDELNGRGTKAGIEWSYLSPAAEVLPGQRTGKFRVGNDHMMVDERGRSRISAEDYAVAMLDEAEKPQHVGRRFSVAY